MQQVVKHKEGSTKLTFKLIKQTVKTIKCKFIIVHFLKAEEDIVSASTVASYRPFPELIGLNRKSSVTSRSGSFYHRTSGISL